MIWERDGDDAYFAAVTGPDGEPLVYLLVEAMPGNGWDWTVWTKDSSARPISGTMRTVQDAMRAAEAAAT